MIILDVNQLGINFGYGKLFDDVSFSLNEGESISIVGPNGCGKSTLLKIIAGLEKQDSGLVSIKKNAKVAYLDQTGSSIQDDRICLEILTSELEKTTTLYDYEINMQINLVTKKLKIDQNLLYTSYNNLSGGEKTLIQLAKALLIKPDLLLLDEPTNHLDIARIEWLENYIKSFKGASVIVSHDRYFLDKMSNKILDIDNGTANVYTGNYSEFLEEKQRDFERQMADYKSQQDLIQKLEKEKKYFAERGMATNSSTLTARAHVLQNKIDRIKENAIKRPKVRKQINAEFEEQRKSSKRVVTVENLTVTAPDKVILDNINVDVVSGERVALIGANGSGKSTLIKTILNEQNLPLRGEVTIGPSVKIGYLPQIISFPNDNQELLEYFMGEAGLNELEARRVLAKFEFYQLDVIKRVGKLSGRRKNESKTCRFVTEKD